MLGKLLRLSTRKKTPIMDPGPGPQELIAGDSDVGYFGTLTTSEFFTAQDLSNSLNLTVGTTNAASFVWFKFIRDGKILFIPSKPLKYNVSWYELYLNGLVYGGREPNASLVSTNINQNRTVSDSSSQYLVRLISTDNNPPVVSLIADSPDTHGSEWNSLLYNLSVTTPPSQVGGNWANLSNADLGLGNNALGSLSLMIEPTTLVDQVSVRGGALVSNVASVNVSNKATVYGWRPVLELIQGQHVVAPQNPRFSVPYLMPISRKNVGDTVLSDFILAPKASVTPIILRTPNIKDTNVDVNFGIRAVSSSVVALRPASRISTSKEF